MLTALKKVIFAEDNAVLTQLPMNQAGQFIKFTHIVVAFSLYFVQFQYDLLGVENFKEFSIWLLVTANAITCLFGSCRGFDRVTIVELFIAAFISFYSKMYLNIPVIAVMLYQTMVRYEGSFANALHLNDPDSVTNEAHPDNWRNWMHVGGTDDD